MCAGWKGSLAARRRSPSACGATSASESACRSRSGSRRTKFLAKVASGVAKPDGLLVVPPDRELAFLHALPVERLWGVGAVTAEKLHATRNHNRRRNRRARRGRPGRHSRAGVGPAPPRPRAQPGSAPGPGTPPPPLDRGATRPRPVAGDQPTRSTRSCSGWSIASPAGCGPPDASAARSSFGCASTTSPARLAPTRSSGRPRKPQTVLDVSRGLLATAMPVIERQGLTLVGLAVGNLENDPAQLALPFDRDNGAPSTPHSTRSATATDRLPSPAPYCSAANPGCRYRCSRIEPSRYRSASHALGPPG